MRKEQQIVRKFINKDFHFISDATKWVKTNFLITVSARTVRRTLKSSGLKSYSRQKKPCLTKKHVKDRLLFAQSHKNWDFFDWNKLIFSDESKFNVHGSDGGKRVWCFKNSLLHESNIQSTKKFGGGNVMVWGCITSKGVGKIIRVSNKMASAEYCTTLTNGLIDTYITKNMKPSEYVFQQDNAPCHNSKESLNWLETNNIPYIKWPANSPDLNPIENVWNMLEIKIRKRSASFYNAEDLWKIIEEEWYKIPKKDISNLYFSMCSRIDAVIKAKGHNTKY